jgi:hypothetical protein
MREERPATQEDVWPVPSETLESFQQLSVDTPCAELVDEFVVIDRQLLPVARDGALYVPGCHDLFVRRRGIRRLDRGFHGGGAPAEEIIYRWVRQEASDHGSGDNNGRKILTYSSVRDPANFSARLLSDPAASSGAISNGNAGIG